MYFDATSGNFERRYLRESCLRKLLSFFLFFFFERATFLRSFVAQYVLLAPCILNDNDEEDERVARRLGMYEHNHLHTTRGSGEDMERNPRHIPHRYIRVWTENHLGTLVLPCLPECTALDQLGRPRGRIAERETRTET